MFLQVKYYLRKFKEYFFSPQPKHLSQKFNSPTYLSLFSSKGRQQLKKNVFFRALPELWGGGLPMPEFFGPLFRSAFWSIKRVYFFKNANVLNF